MSFKRIAIFRNIGIGFLFLIGIISCERDLEEIGVDLTGQRPFNVGDTILEVIAYHRNIDSSRVDNNDISKIPLYLLGVSNSSAFGSLKSDLISQVSLPLNGSDFGDNAIIDTVILDIPYYSTRDGDQNVVDPITGLPIENEAGDTIQAPNFKLDSIYGNTDLDYKISVFELGTFLNALDPDDPAKSKSYYSDKEYVLNDKLYEGDFIPNRNDTVLYVKRSNLDGDPNTVNDIDTIVGVNSAPSMKFVLDEQFFKERFVDHTNSSDFDNNANFTRYFRGLYIDAEGFDGSLANLRASNASMTIYYTNEAIGDEPDGEDLNYNGVTGESDVLIKTKRAKVYGFAGVATGHYDRSYVGSQAEEAVSNPDKVNGESKLYVQGAAGSEVILDIFDQETLDFLQQQDLLINEANLIVYIDGDQQDVPNQLFLYKADFNSLISDYFNFRFGPDSFGGKLEYDDEGNPEKYMFRITNYISKLINPEDSEPISKLALKNYLSTDALPTSVDTLVQDWNWTPKGVVLYGNRPMDNDKRVKLELFYSK